MYFFLLVLGVPLDFTLNVIDKQVGVAKAFPKKGDKFFPGFRVGLFLLNTKLVLLPAKVDPLTKERGCKRYAFMVFCSNSLKIVLELLTEVVAIYVQISVVEVWIPSL